MITNAALSDRFWFWLTGNLRLRFINSDEDGGGKLRYLERYHLLQLKRRSRQLLRFYLHRYVRGDADRSLHRHPFKFCIGIPLRGAYDELRLTGWAQDGTPIVERKRIGWLRPNIITANTYHQVKHVEPGTITLFISGPRLPNWSFLKKTDEGHWCDVIADDPKSGNNWVASAPLGKDAPRAPLSFWRDPNYDHAAPLSVYQ